MTERADRWAQCETCVRARPLVDVIARRFSRVRRTDVRQLPHDVYGLATLTLISEQLLW